MPRTQLTLLLARSTKAADTYRGGYTAAIASRFGYPNSGSASSGMGPSTIHHRLAGSSMAAFSLAMLVGTIAATILLDALAVDLVAIAVFFLGRSVADGNRRAAKWSVAVMAYYLLMAASMLVASQVSPDRIRIGGRAIKPEELSATAWSLAAVALWSGVCLALLIRTLWNAKDAMMPKLVPRA